MQKQIKLSLAIAIWSCGCATPQPVPEKPVETRIDPEPVAVTINASVEQAIEAKQADITPVTVEIPKKYEPLIYGQQKPLVCQETFPATGKMRNRPNLQVMWENYLYDRPEGIWSEIGGLVERNGNLPFDQGRWTNACTVRLSHMLNKAGFKVPQIDAQTVSGANRDQYFFRLADMETYIIEVYGEPDVAILDGSGNSFDLPAKPGIVLLDLPDNSFTGHITVWNGAGTVDGAEIGGYRVLFWELPCFIPADRKNRNETSTIAQSLIP